MAEEHGASNGGDAAAKRTIATRAKDDPSFHLARAAATIVITPAMLAVVGWLVMDKVDTIDSRISEHDTKFEKIEDQLGTIVANQSAGQAQRDAQQKQLDGFQGWLQNLAKRVDNLRR